MKYFIIMLIPCVIIIGCAGEALVEFGVTDDVLLDAPLGDIGMRVLQIDIPEGGAYTTVWNSGKYVEVPVQSSGFVSITDIPVTIVPGNYDHVRVTVDSVRFITDSTVVLIDTTYVFNANAFTTIVIEENDDMSLVINLVSTSWLDANTGTLNGTPFDQAALRVYYE
jgi:hypothetical protein